MNRFRLPQGDALTVLKTLSEESVQCVVTSPPYWGLRDYGVEGQLGLEATSEEHLAAMVAIFREVRRVLRGDGTLWLNYGDVYAGSWGAQSRPDNGDDRVCGDGGTMLHARQIKAHPRMVGTGSLKKTPGLKPKDLVGLPWRLALALQADGWYLRSDIIWSKPNPMPESVTDRPTKAHEYLFLLTKSARYYYDADAVRGVASAATTERFKYRHQYATRAHRQGGTPQSGGLRPDAVESPPNGANLRTVWTIPTEPTPEAHFATFPRKLVLRCIRAGTREGDVVLDPFMGSGTTGIVATGCGRDAIGIELNPAYVEIARRRVEKYGGMFVELEIA